MKIKKLNLGCGADIKKSNDKEEWINLDIVKGPGVDVVWNLNKFPYPFKNNHFGEIYAKFILEHLSDTEKVLREWYRILKKGGKLIIEAPYDISYSAWASFQHKRAFNLHTFNIFVKEQRKKIITKEYNLGFEFSKIRKKLRFPKGAHIEGFFLDLLFNLVPFIQRVYEETGLRALFPAYSIIVELIK